MLQLCTTYVCACACAIVRYHRQAVAFKVHCLLYTTCSDEVIYQLLNAES